MADEKLVQTAINTIRTLSMDAVQKANSGHPGTPMALAPVAYTIWQQLLRYDPADPIWPAATASCFPCGHASMLLYCCCTWPTCGTSIRITATCPDEPSMTLDDIKNFRQLHSRCAGHPGIRLDGRRRNHHRPARPGRRQQRRHGDRREVARRALQQPRLRALRPDAYALCSDGDMMEGIAQRSRFAGRPPAARQPVLDLRRQPHHHRGQHRPCVQRRCREAISMATAGTSLASTTPTISTHHAGVRRVQEHATGPTLIIVDSHHRLRRADQAGHARSSWRTARRRRDQGYQSSSMGGPRTPSFLVPEGVPRTFPRGHRQTRRRCAAAWETKFAAYKGVPATGRELEQMQRARATRWLG